ncbi:nicastrin isoform X4 [Rhododendron vialii]|uniref:nicastrin isoform X4 n=1 Tax=Rhododendron vialii TaxID=182163 RepID=UPI00266042AF|nr:nicastrin isoform X4 [Rhododendron vialii]
MRSSSPRMASKLFCILLCFPALFHASLSEDVNFQSVPDLQKSMYKVVDGFPCVRLLNLSGEIGCSNPDREKVVAPIVRYKNADKLAQLSAILVSLHEFDSFFLRVSNDVDFAKYVGGVLVESGTDVQNELKGVSMDEKFPQAEFSPYKNISYQWNPIGSGIMWNNYDFPVFLLSDSSTSTLKEAAIKNEGNKKAYTTDVAEFDLVMQTTKSGTRDSESCLKEGTCLPLGGYSVWSALPPVNTSSSESSKHIILAVASMDSASFFRDKSLGADSPISGLISLLVAVDALSRVVDDLGKQLVFVIFTGEAWGFLGSRRFLLELDQNSDAVNGLNSSLIDMILEVGSVGKGFSQGTKSFFAHTTQVSAATNETLNALKLAQHSLQSSGIDISKASASNPGIPPSSLMAFLRKNSQTSGVVLEDFDSAFTNQFFHSHLDDLSNINSSSIVAAASIVARTLYILASNKKDLTATSLTLSAINVNASLVEELMGCLLSCEPGLSCELVNHYISPTNTCPSHYVGVVEGEPSSTPYPGYISDVSRFLWNFLAEKTSIPSESASSGCPKNCSGANHLCVRSEIDGKGVCVVSTTRYVPAYSTRLKFESESWELLPPNSSDPMGLVDPVWTESNWRTIGLQVYTVQHAFYDTIVLLAGVSLTILAYLAILLIRSIINKALKQD